MKARLKTIPAWLRKDRRIVVLVPVITVRVQMEALIQRALAGGIKDCPESKLHGLLPQNKASSRPTAKTALDKLKAVCFTAAAETGKMDLQVSRFTGFQRGLPSLWKRAPICMALIFWAR
jgi:hypothetical protein